MRQLFWKSAGFGAGVILAAFVLAVIVDNLEADPEPPRTVTKTVVKYKTPPTVKKSVLSDACREALNMAEKARDNAAKISDVGNKQLDILSDTRMAMFGNDTQELVDLSNRQTTLSTSITGNVADLVQNISRFDNAQKACFDTLDNK